MLFPFSWIQNLDFKRWLRGNIAGVLLSGKSVEMTANFVKLLMHDNLRHFLFFLCFASVQICETYPPARRKHNQVLKNASVC
jgi:hypothetical protein